jgi:putative hydrolase of the HAD superfamily
MPIMRGVIWDLDGTLAERQGLWSGCLAEVLDSEDPGHGIRLEDIRSQLRSGFPWHAPERPHPELCDPEAWWLAMMRLLGAACQRIGYAPDRAERLAALTRARYVDGSVGWAVLPGACAALRRVRDSGCPQVVLSNHVPELAAIMGNLGLLQYVDAVITSALTGFEKPRAEAYAAARAALPGAWDLWMIGDSVQADFHGPERHGIRGILLHGPGTPPPDGVFRCAADPMAAVDMILGPRPPR